MPKGNEVPDKNVEVNGKVIGANSVLRLSLKTAVWILTGIFGLVMAILTYSYFDLKSEVKAFQEQDVQVQDEFIEKVDEKLDKFDDDVHTIRINQEAIRGDIRLILDRQNRDNPVRTNPNVSVQPTIPPPTSSDTIQ